MPARSAAEDDVKETLAITSIIAGVWILLSGGLAFIISYGLSKPLRLLAADMGNVAKLDFRWPSHLSRRAFRLALIRKVLV